MRRLIGDLGPAGAPALIVAILAIGYVVFQGPTRAAAIEDALRRSDVERIVKALETQSQATRDLARVIERCGR